MYRLIHEEPIAPAWEKVDASWLFLATSDVGSQTLGAVQCTSELQLETNSELASVVLSL